MRFLASILALFILAGCGYRPITHYTKEVLGERIYVDMAVSLRDPENTVLIKDALSDAVMTRFRGRLASKDGAESTIKVVLGSVVFSSLADTKDGFTSFYRASVSLGFTYEDKNGKTHSFSTSGRHDFSVDDSSILTDSKRFEAIRIASIQAIDQFISHITMEGAKRVKS